MFKRWKLKLNNDVATSTNKQANKNGSSNQNVKGGINITSNGGGYDAQFAEMNRNFSHMRDMFDEIRETLHKRDKVLQHIKRKVDKNYKEHSEKLNILTHNVKKSAEIMTDYIQGNGVNKEVKEKALRDFKSLK